MLQRPTSKRATGTGFLASLAGQFGHRTCSVRADQTVFILAYLELVPVGEDNSTGAGP
jgi:hypothetical protein